MGSVSRGPQEVGATEKMILDRKKVQISPEVREQCAKKTVTLFTNDLPAAQKFEQDVMKSLSTNHEETLLGKQEPPGTYSYTYYTGI